MSDFDTLEHCKSTVTSRLEMMRYRGEQPTVGEWKEWLEHLESELGSIDLDLHHDDCYSSDQIPGLIEDEVQDRVADQAIKLRQRIAELEKQLEAKPSRRPRVRVGQVRQTRHMLSSQYAVIQALKERANNVYLEAEGGSEEERIAKREYDRLSDALKRLGSQIEEMDRKLRSA